MWKFVWKFTKKFFYSLFYFLKKFFVFYFFFFCKIFDFFRFEFSNLDNARKDIVLQDSKIQYVYQKFYIEKQYLSALKGFYLVDVLYILLFSRNFSISGRMSDFNLILFRSYYRVLNTKNGFYTNYNQLKNSYNFFDTLKNILFVGLKSIWIGLRFWLLSLFVGLSLIYYSMVIRCLPFNKTVFVWIIVAMFSYWILSGFVFFIKKYQYSKFTTAIQRFWRRTYILFWLIEFSLFSVYIYLTFNANQESFYMFDQIQAFKTHLYSWRLFLLKLFPLTLLLIVGYLFLLSMKWNILSKHTVWLLFITLLLVYIVWVEFYQFFHTVNFYGNFNWIYDIDERVWTLELEPRKTRTVNHYVMLMIMLKFWHIVFIFGFWVFSVLRGLEIGRVRYPLISANLQNFLILYLFAWVSMYPWIKFILRRYLDTTYYWFYINNRELGIRIFFNDLNLFYYGIVDLCESYKTNFSNFFKKSFFYWTLNNDDVVFSYRKSYIKNHLVHILNNLK
jgi:hypothetical protein